MQVLNICGKIKRTVISKKLGLCISNIPKAYKDCIKEAIQIELKTAESRGVSKDLDSIYDFYLSSKKSGLNCSIEQKIDRLIDKMICVMPYNYRSSMLFTKNKFCDPIDQIEYGDKFLKFISFLISHRNENLFYRPFKIYDTHFIYDDQLIHILDYLRGSMKNINKSKDVNDCVQDLVSIGKLVDEFIDDQYSFKKLDYIISSLSYVHSEEYEIRHFFNSVSLLIMLLVKPNDKGKIEELDFKLPKFMLDEELDLELKKNLSITIRKIRNKIAHGDFKSLESLLEQYSQEFMKGFYFDYSEYDRDLWIISNLCIKVDRCLANVLWLMLTNNQLLLEIQNKKAD